VAIVTKPMIENLELTIQRDTANANITVDCDVNWSSFDQLTNLAYTERWELVGVDPQSQATLYVGPALVGGISANGNQTTHRSHQDTIAFADLDEDPPGTDEIAVGVTLTLLLPTPKTRQSAQVLVSAP
jgi:hypothetical protein